MSARAKQFRVEHFCNLRMFFWLVAFFDCLSFLFYWEEARLNSYFYVFYLEITIMSKEMNELDFFNKNFPLTISRRMCHACWWGHHQLNEVCIQIERIANNVFFAIKQRKSNHNKGSWSKTSSYRIQIWKLGPLFIDLLFFSKIYARTIIKSQQNYSTDFVKPIEDSVHKYALAIQAFL